MRRTRLGVATIALALVALLVQAAPADALSRSRKPPYDLGCLGAPPCSTQVDAARQGELLSAGHAGPCLFYGPPFVWPCWWDNSTTTGLRVTKSLTGGITAYAKVRGVDVTRAIPGTATTACFGLAYPGGGGYESYACKPLQKGKTTTIATSFDRVTLDPGSYILYVSLAGLPGSGFVERISYRTTATR